MTGVGIGGLLLAVAATTTPSLCRAQEQDARGVPEVAGLVRVISPKLGPDWQVGMFNRIRVEPPCYVVLLFSSDGNYRLRETLSLAELDRLQVHRLYLDQFPLEEIWQEVAGPEYWLEAPLDSLRRVNDRQCPSGLEPEPNHPRHDEARAAPLDR